MSSVSGFNPQYNAASPMQKTYYTEDGHPYTIAEDNNLDIQDFFQLIASQLSNQDFMNPTDNTEFMAQMAQFSALQMQQNILYASNASFASSLVGKTVVTAKLDSTGNLVTTTGVVDRITFANGSFEFVVNDKSFALENLMEIKTPAPPEESNGADGSEESGETGDSTDPTGGEGNQPQE